LSFPDVRKEIEERERAYLSRYAALSANTRGRRLYEEPCLVRTDYQRDRDRIIHSKSFRRLKHKTQVFIAPEGDHYRTRLTHTLEVAQISRTIARALRLNEDLTEAIALGHDLGHTPFGHAGEEVLNEVYPDGFRHNEQSLRIVDRLEGGNSRFDIQGSRFDNGKGEGMDGGGTEGGGNLSGRPLAGAVRSSGFEGGSGGEGSRRAESGGADGGAKGSGRDGGGLNLTWEVRDGILHHTGSGMPATLEGRIVRIADRIAYINHDIDDALRAGIIREEDLPRESIKVLGNDHRSRINSMVLGMIEHSMDRPEIRMGDDIQRATDALRGFLFDRVYIGSLAKKEEQKARRIIEILYHYYVENPSALPPEQQRKAADEGVERCVVDYVAGMTDHFAIKMFELYFLPYSWPI
jgi:dGTPase